MKGFFFRRGPLAQMLLLLSLLLGAWFLGSLILTAQPSRAQSENGGPVYLPIVSAPVPTPTPIPTPTPGPPPQFVKNIDLPTAKCPNAAGFNSVSGYMYIVNNYSYNVTVLKDTEFVNDISTGEWPTSITTDPGSARTWVTNLHAGVSVLEGSGQVAFIPRDYEPYGAAFNPVNGYVYVTDLDSKIQIINGKKLLTTLKLTDPVTGKGAGWMRPIVVDPNTGLVYAASWDYGRLYVIRDLEVIDSVQLGWGPLNMALDSVRGLIYVAHSEPNLTYPHDISVVDVATLNVTFVNSSPGNINHARNVAVDERSGIAYITNPDQNNVTVLQGTKVLRKINVGKRPWGVGVNPNDGYVYVTNRKSGSVSILKDGILVNTEEVQGVEPFAIGVDTNHNDIYVVNRGLEFEAFKCRHGSVSILQ